MATETRQRMFLVDPTTRPIVPEFEGAPRIADLHNKRVGVIDDSKVNAKEYLEAVTDILDERFGVASINYHPKPSASKPADPQVIEEMVKDCDYFIVGVGDWGSCSACSVHDGIHVEKAGKPSVTICTDAFIETSKSMAAMWGTPNYPVIFTPHPIEGLNREQLRACAEEIMDTVISILTGK